MYTFLVTVGTYVLSQLNVLDLHTFAWSKPYTVPPRYNHSATLVGRRLYVYAGKDESGKTVPDLFAVDLDSFKVIPQIGLSGDIAYLKSQHFTEHLGDNNLVVFGKHGDNEYGLWLLDLSTLHWHSLSKEHCLSEGVWNFFTSCPMADLAGPPTTKDTRDRTQQKALLFLGNLDCDRPQPYDHFRDMLVVDPEAMALWQIPEPTLQHDFHSLLSEGMEWADYSLVSQQDPAPIRCHRAVLWARWLHFRHLSHSGMKEATSNSITFPEGREVLVVFLHFLYTDELLAATEWQTLAGLLVMANMYLLPRLTKLCCRRLAQTLTTETCGGIFQASVEAHQEGLKMLVLEFMFKNYGAVLKSRALSGLSEQALDEFLEHVPHDSILISSKK